MPVTIDDALVSALLDKLAEWPQFGIRYALYDGATQVKQSLMDNIGYGRDINGNNYQYVAPVTHDMPIKYGEPYRDLRIRSHVTSNQTAFNVTGQSRNSLAVGKTTDTEFVVTIDSDRADLIFNENAKGGSGVDKPKRDPLGLSQRTPSIKELDLVADEIEKGIEGLVSGF